MTTSVTVRDTALIEVGHATGEQYDITMRGHRVRVDQPVAGGGQDRAPTPTELFVASLAACVAFYAGRYLTRHGYPRDGLMVRAGFTMATERRGRVVGIRIVVHPPAGFPAERVAALNAVVNRCTVHNSLVDPPDVTIRVG